ncbi:acylneuraminate cytidylyltransferase family protein [Chlorobium phaeovibrioides]|uniref:Acylneuraminate cytidylyltransferase family protein n=1 Tax=Chlorobium phaeovibrioides TaxID=1094 RepID=A0A5M8IB13_CHLPH|nr:acylneuraminate cytidylyltransferase family protein [Chlorobium phaeovibrioides]KAA6232626.1 acylneuraminate cytidylyltransferase family protein [Chlorobium phaeovibrioides]
MGEVKSAIAVIPARGGSVGLKNKNIHPVAGRPLLAWTILQAKASALVERVFVSTDDPAIADVAESYGAEVVHRPAEISGDRASSESAILHLLDLLALEGRQDPASIVFLQATSPLRRPGDIDRALQQFEGEGADSLISVTKADDMTLWEKKTGGEWNSVNFDWRNRGMRQERPEQYIENGSIYIFHPSVLRSTGNRIGGKLTAFQMEFWQTWEIDTLAEVELIEFFMKSKNLTTPDIGL